MPIPFRDLRNEDALGTAGYLRFVIDQNGRGIRGALFIVNSSGEPKDFAYSRSELPASFLWRAGEARRQAVASLVAVLFQACPAAPSLLLALADEIHPHLFTEDIMVELPLCRIAEGSDARHVSGESPETVLDSVHLYWVGNPPAVGSPARLVLEGLSSRHFLMEPFQRAAIGLDEAFRE